MYAVLDLKWHQYIVSKWDKITVDKFDKKEWDWFELDTVLAVFDEDAKNVDLWKPYVKWAKAKVKVLSNQKWDKIDVVKFHNKNRYFRKYWFRPHQTILQVEDIMINDK